MDIPEVIKCCVNCGYWGVCESVGKFRKCYNMDIYSNVELDITESLDFCVNGWIKKGGQNERQGNIGTT